MPGFWLKVAWLWQEPLPSVVHVVQTIVGPDYLRDLEARPADL